MNKNYQESLVKLTMIMMVARIRILELMTKCSLHPNFHIASLFWILNLKPKTLKTFFDKNIQKLINSNKVIVNWIIKITSISNVLLHIFVSSKNKRLEICK